MGVSTARPEASRGSRRRLPRPSSGLHRPNGRVDAGLARPDEGDVRTTHDPGVLRMKGLPLLARLYVGGMIALGAALVVVSFPVDSLRTPWLVLLLLTLSSVPSVFKVKL